MSEALRMANLSSEAVALIEEGRPKLKSGHQIASLSDKTQPHGLDSNVKESGPDAASASGAERTLKTKPTREKETAKDVGRGASVSLSVRVPTEIPDALVRASADRKIKRQYPSTQQDIAVEALTLWLRKNGYLDE